MNARGDGPRPKPTFSSVSISFVNRSGANAVVDSSRMIARYAGHDCRVVQQPVDQRLVAVVRPQHVEAARPAPANVRAAAHRQILIPRNEPELVVPGVEIQIEIVPAAHVAVGVDDEGVHGEESEELVDVQVGPDLRAERGRCRSARSAARTP